MVLQENPNEPTEVVRDGRDDFDFLIGAWRVENRRKTEPLDAAATTWVEFSSSSRTRRILGGLGNVETYRAAAFPGRGSYEGMALRLFDPETGLWHIWWASTAQPGFLDVPVVGRFIDGRGRFECDDVVAGRQLKVRYDWRKLTAESARWEQAFSFDEGGSWSSNWTMQLTREAL